MKRTLRMRHPPRLITSTNGTSSGAYAYDGKGMRVKKCVPNCSSPTTTTIYIFAGGKVIAEYDNGAAVGSPSRENIYSGGTQIAKFVGSTITYYHQDHLSNRLVTNSSGTAVEQMGHLPYGDDWYDTGSEKRKFTSYERDAESGNDYALARYDVNRLGRFSSPDPLSGSTANPQSLNRYVYAGNDPINASDPTGQEPMDATNKCFDAHVIDVNAACANYDCAGMQGCSPNDTFWDINGPGGPGDFGGGMGGCGVDECDPEPVDPDSPEGKIAAAQARAAEIIATDPSCGAFFGASFSENEDEPQFGAQAAADQLASSSTVIMPGTPRQNEFTFNPDGSIHSVLHQDATTNSSGLITINRDGAFYNGEAVAFPPGPLNLSVSPPAPAPLNVQSSNGNYSYAGNSMRAQVEIILHEFGHLLGLLGSDSGPGGGPASQSNTDLILQNCGNAINNLSGNQL